MYYLTRLLFFLERIALHFCYWKTDNTSCQLSLLCVPLYLKLIQLILKPYFAINSNHTDSVANLVLISFAINVMPFYTFCPYTNTRFLPVGLFILARVGSTTSFVIIRHILCPLCHPLCYPTRPSLRRIWCVPSCKHACFFALFGTNKVSWQ